MGADRESQLELAPPDRYLLLDSCVLAACYAPQTLNPSNMAAGERIQSIVKSVKNGCSPHIRLLTPEVCVAETQTVLSKRANNRWGGKLKKNDSQAIHGNTYRRIKEEIRSDLHGGRHIESIPLQRYHVLATHMITPVDHKTRIRRQSDGKPANAMGGVDHLIAGVALWLNRFLGNGRLLVVTTDYRMDKVLAKCRKLKRSEASSLGILEVAETIGVDWDSGLYPESINLAKVSEARLAQELGAWPLPQKVRRGGRKRKVVTKKDISELMSLYEALNVGRDRLPYTPAMQRLANSFNEVTGHKLSEQNVWSHLLAELKKPRADRVQAR